MVAVRHAITSDAIIYGIVIVVLVDFLHVEVVDAERPTKCVHHGQTKVTVTVKVLIGGHSLSRDHETNVLFHDFVAMKVTHDVSHLFRNSLALRNLQEILISLQHGIRGKEQT